MKSIIVFYCILWIFILTLAVNSLSSFCGKNELPYGIEITESNEPILKCSKPKCLKSIIQNSAQFHYPNANETLNFYVMNYKLCNKTFSSIKCNGNGEWISGINLSTQNNNSDLNVTCCYNEALQTAKFIKFMFFEKGQKINLGDIKINETLVGFNYINNVIKIVNYDHSISFKVFISQIPCKMPKIVMHAVKSVSENIKLLPKNNDLSPNLPLNDTEQNDNDINSYPSMEFGVCRSDHYNDNDNKQKPCSKIQSFINKRIQNSHNRLYQRTLRLDYRKLYQAPLRQPFKNIPLQIKNSNAKDKLVPNMKQKSTSSESKKNESEAEDHDIEFGTIFERSSIPPTQASLSPTEEPLLQPTTPPQQQDYDDGEEIADEDHSVDFGGECNFDTDFEEESDGGEVEDAGVEGAGAGGAGAGGAGAGGAGAGGAGSGGAGSGGAGSGGAGSGGAGSGGAGSGGAGSGAAGSGAAGSGGAGSGSGGAASGTGAAGSGTGAAGSGTGAAGSGTGAASGGFGSAGTGGFGSAGTGGFGSAGTGGFGSAGSGGGGSGGAGSASGSAGSSGAASAGGGGGGSSGVGAVGAGAGAGACFSGDTTVIILDGKTKRMDELKVGDWILSSAGNGKMGFSKVVSWLHRMPNIESRFLKFTLQNGKFLKITKKHYIYKMDCFANETSILFPLKPVLAEEIQASDCLISVIYRTFQLTKILKIENIQEKGIYAPLTDSGNIIVNDIFASCSSEVDNFLSTFILSTLNNYFKIVAEIFGIYCNSIFEIQQNDIDLFPGIQNLINIAKNVI